MARLAWYCVLSCAILALCSPELSADTTSGPAPVVRNATQDVESETRLRVLEQGMAGLREEFGGLRQEQQRMLEEQRRAGEKRQQELEANVAKQLQDETESSRRWVEFVVAEGDRWFSRIGVFVTVLAAIIPALVYLIVSRKSQAELEQLKESVKQGDAIIKRLEEHERKALETVRNINPDDKKSRQHNDLAIAEAANQQKDLYARHAAEALQAQDRGDWRAALAAWEKAATNDPVAPQARFGIGRAYSSLANENLDSATRKGLLLQAAANYEKTLSLDPEFPDAVNNWGYALALLAAKDLTPDPAACRELLLRATEKYQLAHASKPKHILALNNWGKALAQLAAPDLTPDPAARRVLLHDAKSKYVQAFKHGSPHARYNLARVDSLLGDFPAAKDWLELAATANVIKCPLLRDDPDLAPLREHDPDWFAAFVARVCPEEKDE